MKIFLDDDEIEIIKPLEESEDKGVVIEKDKGGHPTKEETKPDIVKELVAMDTITLGAREAAMIHGVNKESAKLWARGEGIKDPDTKARVVAAKHDIEDLAVAKLMQTLNLLDPANVDKERDLITIASGLSTIIDKVGDSKKDREGNKVLHLHLYDPGRRKESDYETIDV